MAEGRSKAVLVVFKERRRPVTFRASEDSNQEVSNLLEAVKVCFKDVLDSGEGSSTDSTHTVYLQEETKDWGVVDVTGFVEDRSTIYLMRDTQKVTTVSSKAKNLCEKIGKSSEKSARVLANLFPSHAGKRKFNPYADDEVIVENKRKKKAAIPQKGRRKQITVIVLKEKPVVIPKGPIRSRLKQVGRLKTIPFSRIMPADEVKKVIINAFSDTITNFKNFQYLHGHKDNNITVAERQEYDGNGVIALAGSGCLYVKEIPLSSDYPAPNHLDKGNDVENPLGEQSPSTTCSQGNVCTDLNDLPDLIKKADEALALLRSQPVIPGSIEDPIDVLSDSPSLSDFEDQHSTMTHQQLQEWRELRAEQDAAYQQSLQADIAKERQHREKLEWEQKVAQLQETMKLKFDKQVDKELGVKVAFKLPNGDKTDYIFSADSTVKDMYQYVISKRVSPPFSLHLPHPQSTHLQLSFTDGVTPYKDSIVMVTADNICEDESMPSLKEFADSEQEFDLEDESSLLNDNNENIRGSTLIKDKDKEERLLYMESVNAVEGQDHIIERSNLFEDVIDLYREGDIVGECPINIEFKGEMAVDFGGVQRDMYSAFWEEAYHKFFEGANIVTPMIHPQMDMSVFPIIGRILSHGYLVSGIIPMRIALPSLASMFLGPSTTMSSEVLLDTLMDYVSTSERDTLKKALRYNKQESFPGEIQDDLMSVLAAFGCRQVPRPTTIMTLLEQIAKHEFVNKCAAAIAMIHSGIPLNHRPFWEKKTCQEIQQLHNRLVISNKKIVDCLKFPEFENKGQARVGSYLITMIDNMVPDDLRNFTRFVTGGSVCPSSSISVMFNTLTGFQRRPIAHTCDYSLELSTDYSNYDDFRREFNLILAATMQEYTWCMDAL